MHATRDGWFFAGEVRCDPIPPLRVPPCRLVLLGPPGVGKGTQAKLLCERLRACHLATGDLFRTAKSDGAMSPAMRGALDAMQRGDLVSDEVVISMVRERSTCLKCQGGFLLDGFPRTVRQAQTLEGMLTELGAKLDAAICFELPIEEIVDRLSGRRTCLSCQAVFHVTAQPPKYPDVCDHCDEPLIQRRDDHPETIRVRMRAYENDTRPLIDYYERNGKLQRVLAAGSPHEILSDTLQVLAKNGIAVESLSAEAGEGTN